jgi:hypothetical protein
MICYHPCECRSCIAMRCEPVPPIGDPFVGLILCGRCGKANCPHAIDHRLKCALLEAA